MERLMLSRENCKIERTDMYLVRITMNDGTIYEQLEPRRLFPLTNLDKYISFLDDKEREVAMVSHINDLDDESRKAVTDCFDDFYMIPKIQEIIHIEDKFGALKFTVGTDRGVIKFSIRARHSDIKQLRGTGRILIRDSNDNRYEIPSFDALDDRSKKLLFSYT